jgi:type I restriction enzyme S subunit
VSDLNQRAFVALGELADELVEQTGPVSDFVYVDISSIDRQTKKITDPKSLRLSQAPSRAKQLLRAGDVLISMTRPNLNAVALVREQLDGAIGSTGFHVLRSRWLRPEFLLRLVQSQRFVDEMSDLVQGALYPAVRPKDIAAFTFAFETPAQQTRIVAKLEELLSDLDVGVAELKAAQKKLVQYRQSLRKAAVEGALTTKWRAENNPAESGSQLLERSRHERRARWEAKRLANFAEQGKTPPKDWQKKYPEPTPPDTTQLPELPEGWVWASVDQCSLDELAITDGPFGSNLKSSHYQETGPRVIRLQNIGDGVFIDAKAHISQDHYKELRKHAVEKNDLVVAMLGEVLPRACTIPPGVSPAIVKADCARIRLNTNLAIPYVVMSQLNSKPIRDVVLKFVKGIGRPRVNLGHIRAIPLAVCSMEEQQEIARTLVDAESSIEDQMKAIDLSLKQSAAQRQNILRAAFAGQLVPHDPNEEPASVLLERIRAERAERVKQPKTRKTKQRKEITTVMSQLIDVLAESGDWVPAKEAFLRCGVTDGTPTERIEELYAELRKLHKDGRLAVEAVPDAQGRKLYDKLKLLAG